MKTTIKLLLLAALFSCAGLLLAQATGTMSGTVTDQSGSVIPGVAVTARDIATGERRQAKTNNAGQYAFPSLSPGTYEVEFAEKNFAPLKKITVLNVTEHIAVDATLHVGTTTQQVEVVSTGATLQTEDDTLGRVVNGHAMQQLPLATRNFMQILTLSPGTSAPLNNATALGRGTVDISGNGARTGSNAFYIDGVDAVNIHIGSAANNAFASNGVVTPSPDSIQEFKVQTGLYSAQAGRSGGANVSLITRSGTDQFHGSLFEFLRNDALNANLYFFNKEGVKRPELRQNQFGGTLGGPIVHSKLFFFFSYQGTRQVNAVSGSSTLSLPAIPTARTAQTLGAAFGGKAGYHGGTVLATDGSNVNPVALALLNLKFPNGSYVIPSPQTPNTTGVNYAVSVPSTFNEDQYVDAMDDQITHANHLTFKSIYARQPQFNGFPAANVPGFGTTQLFHDGLYSLTDTHIFSSSLVNEARIGVARLSGTTGFQNLIPLSSIGMQRFNSTEFTDIPEILLSGSFTLGYSVNADQGDWDTTWQYFDTLSWVHGKHQIQAGAEVRRYDDNYYTNNRMRGEISFHTMQDFLLGMAGGPTAQGGNGTSYSNITSSTVASGIAHRNDRITDTAYFAQDSWRAATNLTLNFGLRAEYIGQPVDRYGRNGAFYLSNYSAPPAGGSTSAGFVLEGNTQHPISGIPLASNTLTYNKNKMMLGPRVGLAFQPWSKVNLRAGYGLSVDRPSNQLGLLEALSLPNYVDTILSNAADSTATFQSPFPTLPLQSQFPVVPTIYAPPYTNTQPALAINDVDPYFRTPYIQQYGANVQYSPFQNDVIEVGYVGTRGLALTVETLVNQALLASPSNPVNGITTNTASNAALRVPYLGFSATGLTYLQTRATSDYNSLQASMQQSMSHGLQFMVSYTYGKSLDDATDASDGTSFNGFLGDQTNIHQNYGPSDFDRTHVLMINGIYNLPKLQSAWAQSALVGRVVNGWQIAGVGVVQSGLPFSVVDDTGAAYYGMTTSRANFAPGATASSAKLSGSPESRLNAYFNTSAFVAAGNYFGDTGRGILRGPLERNIDFSFIKETPVHDTLNAEFRAEFFNILNFANFASPGDALSSPSNFGVISSTVGNPRIVQFALKLNF
ncbi:MAG: TonB-dependent receptor domain-containing protein [Acidobacteriaceae bacterium]